MLKYVIFLLISFNISARIVSFHGSLYQGDINGVSSDAFSANLLKLNERMLLDDAKKRAILKNPLLQPEELVIIINSFGGSIYSAMAMSDMISLVKKNRKVIILANGICASGCFTILQRATVRAATKNAVLMQHPAYTSSYIQRIYQLIFQSAINGKEMSLKLDKIRLSYEAKRAGIKYEDFYEMIKDDKYFLPKEALKLKLIDFILE